MEEQTLVQRRKKNKALLTQNWNKLQEEGKKHAEKQGQNTRNKSKANKSSVLEQGVKTQCTSAVLELTNERLMLGAMHVL